MSRLAAGAASAALGALLGVAVLVVLDRPPVQPEIISPIAAAATEAPSEPVASSTPEPDASDTTSPVPEPAAPVRVVIPSIDVDADLVGVGLNPDQSMEVPDFGEAGWYEPGPRPGAVGPAVIAAHVDSVDGPDVFYRLEDLEPGDEITVEHADGNRSSFVVEESEQQLKDELPVERIWNTTDDAVLRLITCGGDFDAEQRSYESNVIVYATSAPA